MSNTTITTIGVVAGVVFFVLPIVLFIIQAVRGTYRPGEDDPD